MSFIKNIDWVFYQPEFGAGRYVINFDYNNCRRSMDIEEFKTFMQREHDRLMKIYANRGR